MKSVLFAWETAPWKVISTEQEILLGNAARIKCTDESDVCWVIRIRSTFSVTSADKSCEFSRCLIVAAFTHHSPLPILQNHVTDSNTIATVSAILLFPFLPALIDLWRFLPAQNICVAWHHHRTVSVLIVFIASAVRFGIWTIPSKT